MDWWRYGNERLMNVKKAEAIQEAIASLQRAGLGQEAIEAMLQGAGLDTTKPAGGKPRTVASDEQVRRARPGIYRVAGVHRLYLKKTGAKTGSYFLRYRADKTETVDGKQVIVGRRRPEMGLGSIADVSFEQASALAEKAAVAIRENIDPRAVLITAAHAASGPSMAEAINVYLDAIAPTWRHIYARQNWFNPVQRYALPIIGHLKVDAIETRHVLAVLKLTDEKGVATLGGKVRSRLKTVFDWLIAHGMRNAALGNPAEAGPINAGRPKNSHGKAGHYRRIKKLDDAPAAFQKVYARSPENTALAAWAFMMLTAARPGEALAARWDQIDWEKRIWSNPVSKTGKPLEVPLSSLALAILEQAKDRRVSDLIFANSGGGQLAHSHFASATTRAGIEAGTPHSWRSVFRDTAEDRLHFSRYIAEVALGHSLGAVEEAYRRETGVEKRRAMMEAYANWLDGAQANDYAADEKMKAAA